MTGKKVRNKIESRRKSKGIKRWESDEVCRRIKAFVFIFSSLWFS